MENTKELIQVSRSLAQIRTGNLPNFSQFCTITWSSWRVMYRGRSESFRTNNGWTLPHCYFKVKVKVKLSLCLTKHHAMKAQWGSVGIAPLILWPRNRWRWVVSFTPQPLYPQGKSPWYLLDRKLGETQSRSGRGGEEKNSQPPP
jgi:hypothetical protein